MLYVLGSLAFLQIIFLPGFLFLRYLKIKTQTFVEKIIFIFALSLIINFILVFSLTLLKLYQPPVFYLIFILEVIIFLPTIVNKNIIFRLKIPKKCSFFSKIFFVVCLLVIIRFLYPFFQNLSLRSVFLEGDVIDSWNIWAIQWAKNKIPLATYHYPQLIPTNWSLTYIFMKNTTIEYFAKLLMPLFSIALLLIFFDLAKQTKKISYIFGAIITAGLLHYYLDNSYLRDGYPDIAFAFFAFLPFYCFLLFQENKNYQYLFLMLIFALGSFLTKQLGIYIVFLASILPTRLFLSQGNKLKTIKNPLFLFSFFLLVLIIFWYILKLPEIKTAYNIESIYRAAMTDKLTQFSLSSRFLRSLKLLVPNLKGVLIIGFITLLTFFSLKEKLSQKLFFFLILPLFIFWSLFLNYDQRNLIVIFPYLGYTTALGFIFFLNLFPYIAVALHCKKKIISFNFRSLYFFLLLLLIFIVVFLTVPNNKLIYQQIEGKKQIGLPELNSRLYQYYYKNGFSGKIITNYYRLCQLPEIGQYCIYSPKKITKGKYFLYQKEWLTKSLKSYRQIFSWSNWVFGQQEVN